MAQRLCFVILMALLFSTSGCFETAPPKTQDPEEIKKIRDEHMRDAQRERENK